MRGTSMKMSWVALVIASGLSVSVALGAAVQAVEPPRPQPGEFQTVVAPTRQPMDITVPCVRVEQMPALDGKGDDAVWRNAPEVKTLDCASQREIVLRAVHTADEIAFLVSYPDAAASVTHKSWTWDSKEEVYKPSGDREDLLVLKFSLSGPSADLAIRDGEPHNADIWFWKACRTNPTGYADDKWQTVSKDATKNAVTINGARGAAYLKRGGDKGKATYEDVLPGEYEGPIVKGFKSQEPSGSRADIHATGAWSEGRWTIELARKLRTGNDDDVQLDVGGTYLFGVTCYEMAGTGLEKDTFQPLYRMGDVFDRLHLEVK